MLVLRAVVLVIAIEKSHHTSGCNLSSRVDVGTGSYCLGVADYEHDYEQEQQCRPPRTTHPARPLQHLALRGSAVGDGGHVPA